MDNGALSSRCAAAMGTSRCGLRECDAAAGAALACLSAPSRLGGWPRGGMAALHADVAPYPRLHFCAPALSALVGDVASRFEPLRPRDVAAAALAPSHALASADVNAAGDATLAAALLWRACGDDAADVAAAAQAARASAAAPRPADYAPAGPAVYVTLAPMPSYPVRFTTAEAHEGQQRMRHLNRSDSCFLPSLLSRARRLLRCRAVPLRW